MMVKNIVGIFNRCLKLVAEANTWFISVRVWYEPEQEYLK
jgi:hypothetical protein